LIRLWANIANKLGISQESALLLHGLLRNWLNPLARRKAALIVDEIVERFDLVESDYEASYAQQLLARGILTPTEAEVFAGNYNEDTSSGIATAHGGTPEEGAAGSSTGERPRAAAGSTAARRTTTIA